ncbi:MAG TPA: MerR family transcriptional regulator [Nitrospiria bacterium]|jgi:DNA-binding transcriptional MerR regulator|nr:MerR family transcriptional regulator [Nitrospiria bacterium]
MHPNRSTGNNQKDFFTSHEVGEIIGLTRRQIQHWDHSGLIKPSFRTPGGHSRYTFPDLVSFRTAKKLLDAGVSLQRIRQSIGELQRVLPTVRRPLAELTLVATGDMVLVFYEGTVFEAISGQQWIVEVAEIQQAVDKWQKRVRELGKFRKIHKSHGPSRQIDKAS